MLGDGKEKDDELVQRATLRCLLIVYMKGAGMLFLVNLYTASELYSFQTEKCINRVGKICVSCSRMLFSGCMQQCQAKER